MTATIKGLTWRRVYEKSARDIGVGSGGNISCISLHDRAAPGLNLRVVDHRGGGGPLGGGSCGSCSGCGGGLEEIPGGQLFHLLCFFSQPRTQGGGWRIVWKPARLSNPLLAPGTAPHLSVYLGIVDGGGGSGGGCGGGGGGGWCQ